MHLQGVGAFAALVDVPWTRHTLAAGDVGIPGREPVSQVPTHLRAVRRILQAAAVSAGGDAVVGHATVASGRFDTNDLIEDLGRRWITVARAPGNASERPERN